MEGLGFIAGAGRNELRRDRRVVKKCPAVRMVASVDAPAVASVSQGKADTQQYVMDTYGRYDVTIVEGKGCLLYDDTGKEYLDFVSGIATCALGHASPILNTAVMEQMNRLHHVSNLFYIPQQGELAKILVENSVADKVFFCNSGAEANEAAIKLLRKYASEKHGNENGVILTAKQSFHGRTLATVTATGQAKYQKHFSPMVPGFDYVEYNNVDSLQAAFEKYGNKIIGIILEACQGEGGVVPGEKEFFTAVREFCDSIDALLVMDEVQVGVGRTGKLWGFENLGVVPDAFTIAKGLGGGVPIGALLCTEKANVFKPGEHASTFGGNALSCAAGIAVMQTVTDPDFLRNVQERGDQIRDRLKKLKEKHPELVADIRGWGLISGVELKPDCGFTSVNVIKETTANGLLLVPAGPSVVRFLPPLIVSEEEVTKAMDKFEEVVESLLDQSLLDQK
eukprot:CAMPEP_0184745172 /NCGR_PEP_ID=MMETSP0315-20130426/7843_1 /TAXON_ID=101924 /ORGANISM="Rhodosorus marinus, Strain UTEX LB 2760" /LENGTH=451 /DNA_ID=CAMNT_0027217193 /DNA_START=109 /DNA_END=1464 /DNA_ORIENTATION=+